MDCQNCSSLDQVEFHRRTSNFKFNFILFTDHIALKLMVLDFAVICKDRDVQFATLIEFTLITAMIYMKICSALNLDFLLNCHTNLYHYSNQLFHTKKYYIWFILSNEFHYSWDGWYDGKNYRVSLSDAIKHKE